MLYVGGEDWGWHIKSAYTTEVIQLPMLAVNRWRMDLIFLISGLSVHFLLRDTRIGRFIAHAELAPAVAAGLRHVGRRADPALRRGRVERAGASRGSWPSSCAITVSTTWPEGAFAGWEHGFTWNHLWYLAYLWTYTLVFALLLPLLRRLPNPLRDSCAASGC